MKQTLKPTNICLRQSEKNRKKIYYSELFAKYKNSVTKTWKSTNEVIGNKKNKPKDLPKK